MAGLRACAALSAPIFLTLLASGCGSLDNPPPPPFQVRVRAESDPGRPLPGVVIARMNKELGATGPDGAVVVPMRGNEGDSVDLTVKCPADYTSPLKPITVGLLRLTDQTLPEYTVLCPPTMRNVVVAVRADNGGNLPVLYLNQPVARTDQSGAAHFMVRARPGEQFEVQLATSEKDADRLRPQNPSKLFVVKPQDEVMFFDQHFEIERKAVVYYKRQVPIHIQTGGN